MKRTILLLASTLLVTACTDELTNPNSKARTQRQAIVVPVLPMSVLEARSTAAAINDHGVVAGTSQYPSGFSYATIWRNGTRVTLGALAGQLGSEALDINNVGHVVGNSGPRAFIWYDDARGLVDLGSLGGINTKAWAINNHDQVVGEAQLKNGEWRAFLWENGVMRDLGILAAATFNKSVAYDINDNGVIVGVSTVPGPFNPLDHAFRWGNGVMTDINGPQAYSHAYGINNNNVIVGSMFAGGVSVPAKWSGNAPVQMSSLGRGGLVTDINDDGVMVGESMNNVGQQHAVLWDDNGIRDLSAANVAYSRANAINATETVVGTDNANAIYWGTLAPANRAPVLSIGGPYSGRALDLMPINVTASDPDGDPITFTMDRGDGSGAIGYVSTPRAVFYSAEGDFVLTITAVDPHGAITRQSTAVTIRGINHWPVVDVGGPYEGIVGLAIPLSISASDPDGDPITTLVFASGEGNGLGNVVPAYPPSWTYTTAGTFRLWANASSPGGHTGFAEISVTVYTLEDAIRNLIARIRQLQNDGVLHAGDANRMIASLEAALRSLARGNDNAAANQIGAFLNQLDSDVRSGRLTNDVAGSLATKAQRVLRAMGR